MQIFYLLVLLGICYFVKSYSTKLRIVGGEDAKPWEFPHQVSIHKDGKHTCGGSIIDSKTILSAAHCLYQLENTSDITIVVGTNFHYKLGSTYNISSYIIHENYNNDRMVNDIAILKVEKSIMFGSKVQPIKLAKEPVKSGTILTLSGWGLTSFPGILSDALQKIHLKSIDLETCYYKNEIPLPVNLGHICTLSPINYGACRGDSGGPLMDAARNVQVGIVSWGMPCAKGHPDFFTNVYYYKKWIESKMEGL